MHETANIAETSLAVNLVDLLCQRASQLGDKRLFSFIRTHRDEEQSLSYGQLHHRAMAIAAELQGCVELGERALLLYPPGLEFITAFFGCLYAGVVAVPVSPPRRNRSVSSLKEIVHASNPALILSSCDHWEQEHRTYERVPDLVSRPWVLTDVIEDQERHRWHDPQVCEDHLAFLQYTSGSTSSPKGVMLSHLNLMSNSAVIQRAFGNKSDSSAVFWLPLHHDMGLIGGVIQPVFCGGSATLLAPAAFLQRPLLWLETISRTRAVISGGPDFAYDLCARRIKAEERERLDLSCWELAFTGAEPIRAQTLERFADTFADCGFRRDALYPCYGLAEATLIVTGGPRASLPTVIYVDATALAHNRVRHVECCDEDGRALVGCGANLPGQEVAIADPKTQRRCADGTVGEIWIRGSSVTRGYFGLHAMTESVCRAHLAGTNEGPFLRTGDLGFVQDGMLFVTGRLKDLIIIRGRNYYPHDIELTVEGAHENFRAGHCAAFSVEAHNREQLVVVQEIEPRRRDLDAEAAIQAVRHSVAADHDLEVYAIVLVKAGRIPKTTSGKTRRFAIRELYLGGHLDAIAKWNADMVDTDGGTARTNGKKPTAADIKQWLVEHIAAKLRVPRHEIDETTPFLEFGMGSLEAVEVVVALEHWLEQSLSPTMIYNYPTIGDVAHHLASPPPEIVQPNVCQTLPAQHNDVDPLHLRREVQQLSDAEMEAFIQGEMAKQKGT